MIAAVDVQGWVPHGRSLGHPGRLAEPQHGSSFNDPLADQFRSIDLSDETKEWWILRSCQGNKKGEDELHVKGRTVIWSQGSQAQWQIQRSYTIEDPVVAACWARFHPAPSLHQLAISPPEEPFEALCIVDTQNVTVFAEDGRDYVTSTQFPVSSVWPTHLGVLFEMESPPVNEEPHMELPLVYSLQHPYDDIKPVITKKAGTISAITGPGQRVLFTNENPPLCVIHDAGTGKHSAWSIRVATMQESLSAGGEVDYTYLSDGIFPSASMHIQNLSPATPVISRPRADSFQFSNAPQTPKRKPHASKRHSGDSPVAGSSSSWESPIRRPSLAESLGGASVRTSFTSWRRESSIDLRSPTISMVQDNNLHPLFPEVCLDHLWTESIRGKGKVGPAARVFLSTDMVGTVRLCFMIPSCSQLRMVKMDRTNQQEQLIFGTTSAVSAVDAAPLSELPMIVVLEKNGGLALYSGPHLVAKVMVPTCVPPAAVMQNTPSTRESSMLDSPLDSPHPSNSTFKLRRSSVRPESSLDTSYFSFSNTSCVLSPVVASRSSFIPSISGALLEEQVPEIVKLRDSTARSVTLEYTSGRMVRISLPDMHSSTTVRKVSSVMRSVLKKEEATSFLSKWYCVRNAPGAQNMDSATEWRLFMNTLLGLVGYDVENLSLFQGSSSDIDTDPQEKRKRTADEGTHEDWEWMLGKYGNEMTSLIRQLTLNVNLNPNIKQTPKGSINPDAPLFMQYKRIFTSLHLLYEDMKLDLLERPSLILLAPMLHLMALDLKDLKVADLMWRDFPIQCRRKYGQMTDKALEKLNTSTSSFPSQDIPQVFTFLANLIQHPYRDFKPFPYLTNVNNNTKNLAEIVGYAVFSTNHPTIDHEAYVTKVIGSSQTYNEVPLNSNLPENLKPNIHGINLMLKKGINKDTLARLPPSLALFCLAFTKTCSSPPLDWTAEAYTFIGREDLAKLCADTSNKTPDVPVPLEKTTPVLSENSDEGEDGMEGLDMELLSLRFANDHRIHCVRRMLQSARPVRICVTQRPEVSDHDFIEEQERTLYAFCTRTMALPVGRGMFTLGTIRPVVLEPLPVPRLCLTGKSPTRGTTVDLSHIEVVPNMNLWPLFHNGVAAGLRVSPAAEGIDSTWIAYNKQKGTADSQTEHAGFLMALGLNGHLSSLNSFKIYEYLQKCHEMTSVGLLLGIAASKRGSSDQETSQTIRTICLHIEAMLPPTSLELNIAQNVQVAALLGLGLLYQGSAHRHITEVLLSEIGRPPGPEMENCVDRESYSLAAGLALGLVVLGQGAAPMSDLRDLSIPDTLHHYMVGGHARQLAGSQRDKYRTPSYQIREGDSVNVHVTCPGATLALGMLYFRTGNQAVASWMRPPDTQYLLDFIRPDFLMLRVIARALILWDDIYPHKEWIISNLPTSILPTEWAKPASNDPDFDLETMNQSFSNILAGACFAVGLKFAGTANKIAFTTLLHHATYFTSLIGRSAADIAGKSTIECCISVIVISMCLVMAGTGNLTCLRMIRMLRSRVGSAYPTVTYGSHLATHMALGLLFLGGGRYTLSTSPPAIAALLCAFFPKFPTHSNDNRYHLQAFRHLYVLAAEPRLILPRCVDSRRADYTDLMVVYIDTLWYKDQTVRLRAPCILPELNLISKVSVMGEETDRYWPVVFERGKNWDKLEEMLKYMRSLPVKRYTGGLPYTDDPYGYRTMFYKSLANDMPDSTWTVKLETILAFSSTSPIVDFAELFLKDDEEVDSNNELARKGRLRCFSYECLLQDEAAFLPYISACADVADRLELYQFDPLSLWDVKILYYFINILNVMLPQIEQENLISVISLENSNSIYGSTKARIDSKEEAILPHIIKYLKGGDLSDLDDITTTMVTNYLTFYDMPAPHEMKDITLWNPFEFMKKGCSVAAASKLRKWHTQGLLP